MFFKRVLVRISSVSLLQNILLNKGQTLMHPCYSPSTNPNPKRNGMFVHRARNCVTNQICKLTSKKSTVFRSIGEVQYPGYQFETKYYHVGSESTLQS